MPPSFNAAAPGASGIPASRDDDYVALFFQGHALQFHNFFCSLQPGLIPVTGHNFKEVSLCVHDGVDHKTGIQKRSDFTHVFAEPVAEMTHDRSIRIYPAADFIRQGQIMVVIDGLRAGYRQQQPVY